MPSFDIVSEVDLAEVKNALLQTEKEVAGRFDFRGSNCEVKQEKEGLVLTAENEFKLKALSEILMSKLARRNVSLKNIEHEKIDLSSVGRARQVLKIKQGIESKVAKEIVVAIKEMKLKVQAQICEDKVRVTGKSKDDLQAVMAFLRSWESPVALSFNNFRD